MISARLRTALALVAFLVLAGWSAHGAVFPDTVRADHRDAWLLTGTGSTDRAITRNVVLGDPIKGRARRSDQGL